MLTGWLPVKHHLNKMSTGNSQCHLCTQNETIAHLFQCLKRKQWKRQFQAQLDQYLEKIHTPIYLRTIITTHVADVITNTDEYTHFKHFTIFAGLLPRRWKETLVNKTTSSTPNSDKWIRQLGKWLLTQGHELWLTRNNSLHAKDKKNSTMAVSYTHLTLPTIA